MGIAAGGGGAVGLLTGMGGAALGGFSIGAGSPLGSSLTLSAQKRLLVSASLVLAGGSTVVVDGGLISANSISAWRPPAFLAGPEAGLR